VDDPAAPGSAPNRPDLLRRPPGPLAALGRRTSRILAAGAVLTAAGGALHAVAATPTLTFAVCGLALAMLASVVGEATEQLGARLGPGATGILHSALGNLPELFIGVFALREGLTGVVQAALVGSILGNSLLVLGVAFVAGGLRHGTQRFSGDTARLIVTMTLLSVAALAMPTLAATLHTPAAGHEEHLSLAVSVMLLVVFVGLMVVSLRGDAETAGGDSGAEEASWPPGLSLGLLGGAAAASAFTSDWFVEALTPATQALHLSQGFTGLVIVAIAGNAVENVVGVQLMARDHCDLALNVILQSSLQVALALIPVMVLLSFVVGGAHLVLALPPLLLAALAVTAIVQLAVVYDGESTWIEGVALVGLYAVIAASFWWG
jgi:Ca2+:H+ antiporter